MNKRDDGKQLPQRAALYARVSTDAQRERQTIDAQVDALRGFAPHWNITVVAEYLDNAASGTIPLVERPEGARLMEDARAQKFDVVIFYKMDRLARNLRYILDIVDFFKEVDIGLKSMTEPFDTTNPMGLFIVQMVGAFAQLERDTIIERTSMGRARLASKGQWIGGVLPYGYLLDGDGHLTPDLTPRETYTFAEAEIVQRCYREIADEGGTGMGVAKRLNAEGIPRWHKYHSRGQKEAVYKDTPGGRWYASTISSMVRSETYKGVHTWTVRGETIQSPVEPLVDADTWERAQRQLTSNQRFPTRGSNRLYLLRGLMRCADCGTVYTGALVSSGRQKKAYYRCSSQLGVRKSIEIRCKGKLIPAEWLESLVWEEIRSFVMNPGKVIHKLKKRMDAELKGTPNEEARKRKLQREITQKESANDRMLDAYRRGLMDIDALEVNIHRSRRELEELQGELATILMSEAEKGQTVGKLTNAESLLRALQDKIQGELDWDTRRRVVEALVRGISVKTTGEGHQKGADINITYAFDAQSHAVDNYKGCFADTPWVEP